MKKYKIGELGSVFTGNTPSKRNNEFYESDDIMFIKPDILSFDIIDIKQSNEYLSEKARKKARIIPKGSLLVSCIGNIGKLGINIEEVAFNQQINAIVHNNKITSSKYLAYLLKYNQKKLESIANAPVVPIINKSQFSDFELLIHEELEIQRKIVEILDKAQELIDKRKEQIKELDELVKSQFIEMFGDPVSNPKGWEKGKIADIIIKTQYGTSNKANEENGQFKILRMGNITYNGHFDFSDMKYIDLTEDEQKKYLVYKGEVLFNRTNSKELVGKTAVYKENEPMAYAGYLVKALPNERATGEFIAAYMNTKYVKSKLLNMAKNIVGMANINAEEFKKIDIYIPPIELQNEYIKFIEQVDKLKFEMENSLKELEDNFNSLMQRAFKGELIK
ncbi:MAG: restriction endonuclease subunit S [Clostridium sp.]|uniref:restriction endonuclease subunit S n=5 Tax=Clostridium TaxID=1485 RepID=UPI0025B7BC6D|nr:restriction endonuclease subunit S [Clostridium sp.]MCI9303283.1 restriction endonuclease subunit S [Clostridium sp.]